MKLIAISQRCDYFPQSSEFRDCLDVNFSPMLGDMGYQPLLIPSRIKNIERYLSSIEIHGFILSGGNNIGESPQRDQIESVILSYSKSRKIPLLGICRGMQFINHYQGGRLSKTSGHTNVSHVISGELTQNLLIEVNSFHDFGLLRHDLGKDLNPTAFSDDGEVEAIIHSISPWIV